MAARARSLLALFASVALAACGGGGGDPGASPAPAPAPAPAPIGGDVDARDFRVNSTTAGRQSLAPGAVARLAGGGHVAVWTSQLAGGRSVRLQRLDADSRPVGLETVVASTGESAAVAPLADGGFLVSWNGTPGSGGPGLMQRFGPIGQPVGPVQRFNSIDGLFFLNARPVLLASGRVLLAWTFTTANRTGTPQAAMRLFNADGSAASVEMPLMPQLGTLDAAALPDGGFVIAWSTSEVVEGRVQSVVRSRVYDADGSLRRADLAVPAQAGTDAMNPAVTALSDGRYALAWESMSGTGGGRTRVQLYDATAAGGATGAPVEVGESPTFFMLPAITGLAGGGFAVAWQQVQERDAQYRRETQAQRFDASGARRGSLLRIASAQAAGLAGFDNDLRFNDRLSLAEAAGGFLLLLQQPDAGAPADWDVQGARR